MIKLNLKLPTSIGPFNIDDNIKDYKPLYDYTFSKGEGDWDVYIFFDDTVEVYVENEKVVAIACRKNCYLDNINLIGLEFKECIKLLSVDVTKIKAEKLWVSDEEMQTVYDIDKFDLQIWVNEKNKIETIFLG